MEMEDRKRGEIVIIMEIIDQNRMEEKKRGRKS